jgi:hypothetical protein
MCEDSPSATGRGSIGRKLLDYWIQHPDSQGTLESIVEWWLLEQQIQHAATEVRAALADLIAEGLVMKREQSDGRVVYRLNREKLTDIRACMKASDSEGKPAPEN